MDKQERYDAWAEGGNYEQYMGRWSRLIAARFLDWLKAPVAADWLELGCGTGALTSAILERCAPASVLATDASGDFLGHTQGAITDPKVRFQTAVAEDLALGDGCVDVVTSGLVLNFLPDRTAALAEMWRVLRPGGWLTFYVWDYPDGGLGFVDAFWKAAADIDPAASELDEGARFSFCTEDGLAALCHGAGIAAPEIAPIGIVTEFADFEALWHPFTLGTGPAPGYCVSLPDDRRLALKARLRERLGPDAPLRLAARAWAVKARRSG